MERKKDGAEFLSHLQNEKLKTQEVRAGFVSRKLIFTTTLLGVGTLKAEEIYLNLLLYLVPFVTLSFDLYILAEDYSVKRIGKFLELKSASPLEKEWERFVSKNRDPFALFSMSFLTTLLTIGAAIIIGIKSEVLNFYFWLWLATSLILCWSLFFYNLILRKRVDQSLKRT